MFTGIIEALGKVERIEEDGTGQKLHLGKYSFELKNIPNAELIAPEEFKEPSSARWARMRSGNFCEKRLCSAMMSCQSSYVPSDKALNFTLGFMSLPFSLLKSAFEYNRGGEAVKLKLSPKS